MKSLLIHLVLTRRWYDEIDSGKKKIEYRKLAKWKKQILENDTPYVAFHRGYVKATMFFKVAKIIARDTIELRLGDRLKCPPFESKCRCCQAGHDPTKFTVIDENDLCETCHTGKCPEYELRGLWFKRLSMDKDGGIREVRKFKPKVCEVDKDGIWWQVTPDKVSKIKKEDSKIA